MGYVVVTFTPEQRQRVIAEAERRQAVNERNHVQGRNGAAAVGPKSLRLHYFGAAGEMAVAILLGCTDRIYTETSPVRGSPDMPGQIDVKTAQKHSHKLIVQGDAPIDKRYVLVTIERREIRVHGWLEGEEAMDNTYWADPVGGRPAFFIPRDVLNPIEELRL